MVASCAGGAIAATHVVWSVDVDPIPPDRGPRRERSGSYLLGTQGSHSGISWGQAQGVEFLDLGFSMYVCVYILPFSKR
jgi:hypothetical protein